jgi:hypothetical protein
MLELDLDPIDVHGEVRRDSNGRRVGRLILTMAAGNRVVVESADPQVFEHLARVAADVSERRREQIARVSVEHTIRCPRCQEMTDRLVLVATFNEAEPVVQMCNPCAGEVCPPLNRDHLGRLRCCGAGPDQRDPRTGQDLHLPHCSTLQQAS